MMIVGAWGVWILVEPGRSLSRASIFEVISHLAQVCARPPSIE